MFTSLGVVQAQTAPPSPPEGPPPIADNSFLLEEAYNQEYGVVQHINTFSRFWQSRDLIYTFTQEWPFNPAPKAQLSYTVVGLRPSGSPDKSGGFGDLALNYRYQLVSNERWAFAPRVSLLLPTGDHKQGRGAGGVGIQFNMPVSVTAGPKLVTHWNAGATFIPNAKNPLDHEAVVRGYNLGQSFVYLAHPRFNLMLETAFNSSEEVIAPNFTQRFNDVLINPGFRWSHNLKNGTQIVPGFSVPVGVGPSAGEAGVFFYLSIEHPFGKKKGD
ncbi:MAG TPA: hypothetical protein VM056_03365 [Terriglobales bacterium]|nr:hypothetical protein [Terriglobales bacterium]